MTDAKQQREARLAAQLRANLLRRKAQTRAEPPPDQLSPPEIDGGR